MDHLYGALVDLCSDQWDHHDGSLDFTMAPPLHFVLYEAPLSNTTQHNMMNVDELIYVSGDLILQMSSPVIWPTTRSSLLLRWTRAAPTCRTTWPTTCHRITNTDSEEAPLSGKRKAATMARTTAGFTTRSRSMERNCTWNWRQTTTCSHLD